MTRDGRLLDELRNYAPSDDVEAAHRRAMLDLLERGDAAFTRGHFAPGHFTASCYISDDAGRLLLHHHRRLDRWLQMGGHIEINESPGVAALREGREESGLDDLVLVGDGIFDLDIHPIPAAKGEPDHHHFDVRYLARTSTPDAVIVDRAESNELAWFSLARAAELMPGPEFARVLRKLRGSNREIVQRVFDALSKGDSRPLLDLLAEDVTWRVMGQTPWSRTYAGKGSVIDDLLRPLGSRLAERYRATAKRIVAEGDSVVVEAIGQAITKRGVPYNNEYCFVYRLENGSIKEVTEYLDTELVVAALGE
ncbi:MAG TPA: nuclear transport factor 2 family protein [Thermoanaerobaculia bacterium]